MKKCKNCQVNNARYICLGCNREFCTFCMKEDELFCSRCKYNNKQQRQQHGNEFKLKKNNHHRITNTINIIIASSILFLGIILVLTSYPSIVNMISSNSNDGIMSEEKENNNNINGYIYIFPFPFAIPFEFNMSFILPLILIFIIIIPIIMFIIILKSIKIS
jgi:hypothetical protein